MHEPTEPQRQDLPYFDVKHRALGYLWAWGLANVAAGALLGRSQNTVVRHIGGQALVWGAIDASLAYAGRRDAMLAPARGDDPALAARKDRRILLINAGLDIGYLCGGAWLVHTARGRSDRVGMGLGIIPQGLFLLVFDTLLGWLFGRWVVYSGGQNG